MWTKQYIFKPTKEEYFKTKHPIATLFMLVPMILYYLTIAFGGADKYNWWILGGFVGCLILGVGLAYIFAVKVKIYQKVLLPTLCLILGTVLIVVSLLILLQCYQIITFEGGAHKTPPSLFLKETIVSKRKAHICTYNPMDLKKQKLQIFQLCHVIHLAIYQRRIVLWR